MLISSSCWIKYVSSHLKIGRIHLHKAGKSTLIIMTINLLKKAYKLHINYYLGIFIVNRKHQGPRMNFVNNVRHPPWLEVADLARSGRDSPGNRLRPPGSQGAGLVAAAGFSKKESSSWAVLSSLGCLVEHEAITMPGALLVCTMYMYSMSAYNT